MSSYQFNSDYTTRTHQRLRPAKRRKINKDMEYDTIILDTSGDMKRGDIRQRPSVIKLDVFCNDIKGLKYLHNFNNR